MWARRLATPHVELLGCDEQEAAVAQDLVLATVALAGLALLASTGSSTTLILDGKSQCKEDIFETIRYFKSLSGNKS